MRHYKIKHTDGTLLAEGHNKFVAFCIFEKLCEVYGKRNIIIEYGKDDFK